MSSAKKRLIVVQRWLPQGQEPNEKIQPIHRSYEQNSQLVQW